MRKMPANKIEARIRIFTIGNGLYDVVHYAAGLNGEMTIIVRDVTVDKADEIARNVATITNITYPFV